MIQSEKASENRRQLVLEIEIHRLLLSPSGLSNVRSSPPMRIKKRNSRCKNSNKQYLKSTGRKEANRFEKKVLFIHRVRRLDRRE